MTRNTPPDPEPDPEPDQTSAVDPHEADEVSDETIGSRETLLPAARTELVEIAYSKTVAIRGESAPIDPDATIRAAPVVGTGAETLAQDRGRERDSSPPISGREFEILDAIGQGGMGVVYKARQLGLEREVAVKTMRDELRSRPELQEDFVSEAIVTGILDHPNIVPVHAMNESRDGLVSFAMKLVGGRPWSALLHPEDEDTEALDLERHLEILRAVSNAVAFAHSKGILHRDLKPDNVMVGDFGEVLLMDWGLACRFGELEPKSSATASTRGRHASSVTHIEGTPSYLAPEMATGEGDLFGPWTDVYLLGAILHEILAGRAPHQGTTVKELIMNAAGSSPPIFDDSIPSGLQKICRKAMAQKVSDRFLDTKEFIDALREYDQHRESEKIATSARAEVAKGRDEKQAKRAYARYQRGIAGYEQAISIWPGNLEAAEDLSSTHEEIAELALEQGDLGLARSHVEALEDHAILKQRIEKAEAEQERIRRAARRQRQVLAASGLIVITALSIGFVLVSKEKERVTTEKQRADRESAAKSVALDEKQVALDDFARMSDIKRLANARSEAEDLWPCHPDLVPKLEQWQKDYRDLFSRLSVHEETLQRLRERAIDYSAEQRRLDYADEFAEIERLEAERKGLEAKLEQRESDRVLNRLDEIEERRDELGETVEERKSWDFGQDIDSAFMQESLEKLVEGLRFETGARGTVSSVKKRLILSRKIKAATLDDHAEEWRKTMAGIQANPRYGGLVIKPRIGLIPLSADPKTGFFEFLHWLSHEPGAPLPVRNGKGRFAVKEETGIILVLIPGGRFWMGSQDEDVSKPNHDPAGGGGESPVHEVDLDPFFIGKHEVTQAQWQRFTGDIVAYWNPEYRPGPITWTNPVETVDWTDSDRFARQIGLSLPTEAQWEYACRAGTATPYSSGTTLSPQMANIRDEAFAKAFRSLAEFEHDFDDKFGYHAPVGSLAPNGFGLFDTLGNVWEWCQDWYGSYATDKVKAGTGLRLFQGSRYRVYRGGSFHNLAVIARSASRGRNALEIRHDDLGLRVSLQVHH